LSEFLSVERHNLTGYLVLTEFVAFKPGQSKSLFVIARNSSFTYKARLVDLKQVGRELGVRYVLEGSVHCLEGHHQIGIAERSDPDGTLRPSWAALRTVKAKGKIDVLVANAGVGVKARKGHHSYSLQGNLPPSRSALSVRGKDRRRQSECEHRQNR
jgi:hypothetical protein